MSRHASVYFPVEEAPLGYTIGVAGAVSARLTRLNVDSSPDLRAGMEPFVTCNVPTRPHPAANSTWLYQTAVTNPNLAAIICDTPRETAPVRVRGKKGAHRLSRSWCANSRPGAVVARVHAYARKVYSYFSAENRYRRAAARERRDAGSPYFVQTANGTVCSFFTRPARYVEFPRSGPVRSPYPVTPESGWRGVVPELWKAHFPYEASGEAVRI